MTKINFCAEGLIFASLSGMKCTLTAKHIKSLNNTQKFDLHTKHISQNIRKHCESMNEDYSNTFKYCDLSRTS